MPDAQKPLPRVDADGKLIPFHVYARCTENDIEYDWDGGKVLLQAIGHQEIGDLNGCNLVFQFTTDAAMQPFPITRAEKQQRFFKVTVEEIENPIPPAPEAPTPLPSGTAEMMALMERNALLESQLAALQAAQATTEEPTTA